MHAELSFQVLYSLTSIVPALRAGLFTMGTLPLVPVAAYISYDITYAWALQYVWSVYGV